jgi:transcriptional regulator with XRE-family HTH domain
MEELLRSLGRRIRDLRSQRGWSQEKFSEICDVHRTWMGQIERGKNISVKTLANIADGLGVTLSELFAGVEVGAGEDRADDATTGKATAQGIPSIRSGQQTVNALVEELRAERAALERTVATLREVALDRRRKPATASRKPSTRPGSKRKKS